MDHDEAIRWVNRELAGLPRESTSKMGRKFRSELIGLLGVLQTGKRTGQIVFERLMPLCPCSLDPEDDGPQPDCPIHGDDESFARLCRWRDRVVAAAQALVGVFDADRPDVLADVPGLARFCDLLDDGPWPTDPIDTNTDPRFAHLRADAPQAQCSTCGRWTVAVAEFGKPCLMPQPDGRRCAGSFTDPSAAQVSGPAAELEIQGREGIRDVGWF